MRRTLFLNPPSFEGFDGGAGARYQARREVRSFWYPTWLAHPAAMVPGSRLVDAPPAGLDLEAILPLADEFELAVIHTSTPSFYHDARTAEALKETNPKLEIGFVGSHTDVLPAESLEKAKAVDWVTRGEFDHTVVEVAAGAVAAGSRSPSGPLVGSPPPHPAVARRRNNRSTPVRMRAVSQSRRRRPAVPLSLRLRR